MKKIILFLFILSRLSFGTIFNPIEGSELEIGSFNHDSIGAIQYKGDELDTQKDLKWSSVNDIFAKAYLEHPLPLIPNIRIGYTKFSHVGEGKIDGTLHFGSRSYSSDIASNINLKMYDLALYYNLLDNRVINAGIGLNMKHMEGVISLSDADGQESKDFDFTVPTLYARVEMEIPTTHLSLQAEGNYVTLNGKNIYDAEAGLRYTFESGLGVETGYKVMHLKFDKEDELMMESDFSGAYGKLVLGF